MEELFWSPVRLSISIAFVAGVFVLFLGVILAKVMSTTRFKGRLLIETLLMLPIVLPPTVIGFFLIVIFGRNSPIGSFIEMLFGQSLMFTWWAAFIASAIVAFPLMYQTAKTGFQSIDKGIEEAAKIDGASNGLVFLFVSIPLARKAIIAGFVLSFARALGEFGATLMFAGMIPGKTLTLPTAIYVAIDSGNMGLAWAWVGLTVTISFLMLLSTYLIRD
ncbi:molybdate ABC transporter permease subunit [Bacillus sp. PS06]|uniref:molybdate ABC transporter permease subunit n=1 Tax=Bacillus sp. PS06 TaxID=2764176 RepID=UPI00177D4192|nr:molybdate ABC transporter permease subunit [Bacillus sp. PS06]MBD8067564.1 molybdate ABC transporter permease subunit [Bacillus sp. PS06]